MVSCFAAAVEKRRDETLARWHEQFDRIVKMADDGEMFPLKRGSGIHNKALNWMVREGMIRITKYHPYGIQIEVVATGKKTAGVSALRDRYAGRARNRLTGAVDDMASDRPRVIYEDDPDSTADDTGTFLVFGSNGFAKLVRVEEIR